MDTSDQYEFTFDAYTPETIPLERLALYMTHVAKLFGHTEGVHFEKVLTGSTRSILNVEQEASAGVADRLHSVSLGMTANAEAYKSFDAINKLLKEDGAVGRLLRRHPHERDFAQVLYFKGRELPTPVRYGPFTESAEIDGELVRIGGKDNTAHAVIVDAENKSWPGIVSRELAKELAQFLYAGPILRVKGEARWERQENGDWKLLEFKIGEFDQLEDKTLTESILKLRGFEPTDWSLIDDLDEHIHGMRNDFDGGVQ